METFKLVILAAGLETRRADMLAVAAFVAPVATPLGERAGAGVVRRWFQYSGTTG